MNRKTSIHQRFAAIAEPPASQTNQTTSAWYDIEALAILKRPAPTGGSALEFQAKERELMSLFARLTANESRMLHRRLTVPQRDDALAGAFERLVADRRGRLLAFVADARRREALQAAPRLHDESGANSNT
ncbi:MAG TPA: hypothetical protein VGM90_36150 [Kofleriaceae bacterium]|jgi:hypothetical protein